LVGRHLAKDGRKLTAALRCSPPSDSQPESHAARICVSLEISLKLLIADPGTSIYPMRGSAITRPKLRRRVDLQAPVN